MKKTRSLKKKRLAKKSREKDRTEDDASSQFSRRSLSQSQQQPSQSNIGRQLDHRTRRGMLANTKNMLDATKALLGNQ